MTMTLSGPMFERAQSGFWESMFKKDGAHYNSYGCHDRDGMQALRQFFPNGADENNLVLFSTSGIHGTYRTIEEAEAILANDGIDAEDGEPVTPAVTFLILQPRICCLRHGNCIPATADDIAFLKRLREESWRITQAIGRHEPETRSDG